MCLYGNQQTLFLSTFTIKNKIKITSETIYRKYSKSVSKLIVYKFTNKFLNPSIITDYRQNFEFVGKFVSKFSDE